MALVGTGTESLAQGTAASNVSGDGADAHAPLHRVPSCDRDRRALAVDLPRRRRSCDRVRTPLVAARTSTPHGGEPHARADATGANRRSAKPAALGTKRRSIAFHNNLLTKIDCGCFKEGRSTDSKEPQSICKPSTDNHCSKKQIVKHIFSQKSKNNKSEQTHTDTTNSFIAPPPRRRHRSTRHSQPTRAKAAAHRRTVPGLRRYACQRSTLLTGRSFRSAPPPQTCRS